MVLCLPAAAQFRSSYGQRAPQPGSVPGKPGAAGSPVYPQFRSQYGTIRWLKEQMPLKVYVSPGLSLDSFLDPQFGSSAMNVENRAQWPDIVADVVQDRQRLQSLPVAQGYLPEHFRAAIDGINLWKTFEPEGLFSFILTNDPGDADIYVFWTNHFVNKLGLGLFENDIRGYTAKRSFPYAAVLAHKNVEFRPVVSLLRTTDSNGTPMSLAKMRASAAHEFGHALGIEGHSTNANDLMSIYYGHGTISKADAATIRYLYHLTPDLIP